MIAQEDELAEEVLSLLWSKFPKYEQIFDKFGKEECKQDIKYHVRYLSDAVDAESQTIFLQYVQWVKTLFSSISIPYESFVESLKAIEEVIEKRVSSSPPDGTERALGYLEESIKQFSRMPVTRESLITEENPMAEIANMYLTSMLDRDRNRAMKLILDEVESGRDIRDIYENVFQVSQWEIGRLWQENKISVAQEHYCTAVTQLVMSRLYPYIFNREKNGLVFVGASVGDELHELGIRMIADFFELDGWDTYFLGAHMPSDSIVETVKEEEAHVLGISVTIAYHLHKAKEIIEKVRTNPDLSEIKILVGGYPFNQDSELWKRVGADGTGSTARDAIVTAKNLIGKQV